MRTFLALILLPLAGAADRMPMPPGFQPAYPPSPVLLGATFDDKTERMLAPGSDIWPITWAADGHLYTAFGDGGGFGGTNKDGRVLLGVARVEGGKDDYRGVNIAGGKDAPHPAPFGGKSEGILAIDRTLYLWRDGDASSPGYFKFVELWRSDDFGAKWRFTGVRFSKGGGDFPAGDEGFFAPAFCQFGKAYAGARDNYVYIYAPDSIDPSHWRVRVPGRINLLRVPRNRMEAKEAYEFFAGAGADSKPRWTNSAAERKPAWQDPVNGTHRIAISYNPVLKRYLLTTIHRVREEGWMAIYDAPEPWGPWTLAHCERNPERWGSEVRGPIIFTFVNKWLSSDGKSFVIVHTKNDAWATIEGRFKFADGR